MTSYAPGTPPEVMRALDEQWLNPNSGNDPRMLLLRALEQRMAMGGPNGTFGDVFNGNRGMPGNRTTANEMSRSGVDSGYLFTQAQPKPAPVARPAPIPKPQPATTMRPPPAPRPAAPRPQPGLLQRAF